MRHTVLYYAIIYYTLPYSTILYSTLRYTIAALLHFVGATLRFGLDAVPDGIQHAEHRGFNWDLGF